MDPLQKADIKELETEEAGRLQIQGRRLETTLNAPTTSVSDEWQGLTATIIANVFPRLFDWILQTQRGIRVSQFEREIVKTAQQVGANAVYMPFELDRMVGNVPDFEYSRVEFYRK